jgi:hypothetical protein
MEIHYSGTKHNQENQAIKQKKGSFQLKCILTLILKKKGRQTDILTEIVDRKGNRTRDHCLRVRIKNHVCYTIHQCIKE